MEEVNLSNPRKVIETRWIIKLGTIGYCELHGNPMRVKYLEAYRGLCWVGDCGCATNWVDKGYKHYEISS